MAAGRASRHRTDPRNELAEAERLDDVVVGAELEADDPIDLLALGGDDDDRDVRAGAQLAADRESVDIGQSEVEQDEVGPACVERFAAPLPRASRRTLGEEAFGERLCDRVLVLDDEQVHAH